MSVSMCVCRFETAKDQRSLYYFFFVTFFWGDGSFHFLSGHIKLAGLVDSASSDLTCKSRSIILWQTIVANVA